MVPTSQKFYLSSILAYIVSAGLSFLVAPDIFSVMGYVVYFGPMAVLSGILYDNRHKVKWWLALIIKIIYINGAIALLYFVCHNIVIDPTIAEKLPYWAIAIIGTIVLVVIDYILQFVYKRIAIVVGKALRKIDKKDQENVVIINDDEDEIDRSLNNPFDEFCQLTIAAMIKATAIVTTAMTKARIKRMTNPTKTRNKTETTQINLFEIKSGGTQSCAVAF